MNVLITGGGGFVGSHLADRLLARDDTVTVIDNFSTGRRDNLTPTDRLDVVEGTIADPDLVEEVFARSKPDVVVHAAASYKDPENWQEDARTNTLGSAIIAQASRQHAVRRLIYFQTSLCYGLNPVEQPITLKHPLFGGGYPGGSSYAISKTSGEQYIELSGLDFISFRLANAYGPRNLSGPLPIFYQRLSAGKGCFVVDTRRDFIYIADLVDVVVKAIDGMGEKGYYHISSGTDYAIKDLYDAVVAALDITPAVEVDIRERSADDVYTILIDPTKTEQDFDWKVSTPLEEGVRSAVDYYREYGITQTFTHLRRSESESQ